MFCVLLKCTIQRFSIRRQFLGICANHLIFYSMLREVSKLSIRTCAAAWSA
jgi:hypothetical protein